MEPIKELRQICQGQRKDSDSWHMKYIARKPSIYITWLLLHTNISANQVTCLFVAIGLLTSMVFTMGTKPAFFAGALLLQFWYVIDMVDGEIARYRKQSSLTGVYFDCITHYIIHPVIIACIGLGLFNIYHNISLFLAGVLAAYSICMITVIADVYNNVLFLRLSKQLLKTHYRPEFTGTSAESSKNDTGLVKRIFSLLHLICTFPSVMNILLILSAINLFIKYDLMVLFVFFYSLMATLIWVSRLTVFIKTRKIDKEAAQITPAL